MRTHCLGRLPWGSTSPARSSLASDVKESLRRVALRLAPVRQVAAEHAQRLLEPCRRMLDSELTALVFFVALILTTFLI